MSHNPWPFVVVALGSLGFLANSMAQNNNRFDNFLDDSGQRFADDGNQPMVVVRETNPDEIRANTDFMKSPFDDAGADDSLEAGGTIESWDAFDQRTGTRREQEARQPPASNPRFGTHELDMRRDDPEKAIAKIRDVQTSSFIPREPAGTRVAQGTRAQDRPLFGTPQSGGVTARPARTIPRSSRFTAADEEAAQLDGFRGTRNTSLLGRTDRDILGNLDTNKYSPSINPIKETVADNPLTDEKNPLSKAFKSAATPGSVPFWLTLGLFFSLPANLFFGWYAMSMHSRYEDLLQDMQVSDSRLERETRRRREPHEDRRPRRSRDADEEAFLHGGIEV